MPTTIPTPPRIRARILLFLLFPLLYFLFPISAPASQPPFRGQYTISSIDGDATNGWRLSGVFDDSSLLGYGAADATNGDLLFASSSLGDLDIYQVTNIVGVTGINLTLDVLYNETGTPRSGAPEAGVAILARPTTNNVVPRLPGIGFSTFSADLLNDAINLNLYYAYLAASTNGAPSTNAASLAGWSGFDATQMIEWVESELVPNTNIIVLSVTEAISPTNVMSDPVYYIADNGDYTNSLWPGQYVTATKSNAWVIADFTSSAYWENLYGNIIPTGLYFSTDWESGSTGKMSAAYAVTTNLYTWRAGYNATADCWQVSRDGVVLQSWFASSNVFPGPITFGDSVTIGDESRTNWPPVPDFGVSDSTAYRGDHGDAASNLASTAHGWGNHALAGYLTAIAYGISSATAYRGDWGEAVSNLAAAALPKAGGDLAGDVNAAGHNISGAGTITTTNLAVPGDNPTNDAIAYSKDASGNLGWRTLSYMTLKPYGQALVNTAGGYTNQFYTAQPVVSRGTALSASTNGITILRDGHYLIQTTFKANNVTNSVQAGIFYNDTAVYYSSIHTPSPLNRVICDMSHLWPLSSGNVVRVRYYNAGNAAGQTNYGSTAAGGYLSVMELP